ncbi:tRNA (uridine(34)/cytosine(34)/5-carboxymethylaminomethyluridine(34)-2'-O)-methyltransferase TrmL [Catenovulum adriaticum]|uniref:tRNA (cytidine(34)-2'-O)-methyltransferase n=1 Tax=Catenovulum adriaticum TaxID=2984846 RepID=A0ABY7AMW7_9ALTE|nr:tRNA (uridine(34)/cytosine(34)/5-carboxymethylaminomethyluridine(34)-2'-O)-methyltransferase TrmL [Catenovulum sp. TS8]WAJ70491.1 tRNA (uridine(34)/cytosine(34)/5-carboxymethylaminomethyluridine(34)-2'-O)-methyltransferase TrmL [Catenovulum sp. TS8]
MLHVVLHQPDIPQNTGNIIRLCANSGFKLHLIEPLGFEWDDKRVKRAGLDYHEFADVKRYPNFQACIDEIKPKNIYACTTHGTRYHSEVSYQAGDMLLFGSETKGLPVEIREGMIAAQNRVLLPMMPDSRSLNLSNSVAIFVYEAWRQLSFEQAKPAPGYVK